MHVNCFEDFKLSTEVMKGITELGWETPSPIQAQSIIPLLDGRDLVGQAQTGTGKTAAYGIPMIELIEPNLKYNQGLVLAPTRELAIQITDHLNRLGKYREVKILTVYGGDSMQRQIKALRSGVHIVVGTPGRILDHISHGTLNLRKTKIVVIDEADRMLDMGFIEDIQKILNNTPKDKQISLFSATIGRNVMQICNKFMRYPEKVLVSKDEIALTQLDQYYVKVEAYNKFKALLNIINEYQIERAIIFCKTQHGAERLAKMLASKKYNAKPLHGGLTQPQREYVVDQFRRGKLNFLVATDVASRGLDIQNITHIINHNLPQDPEVYFHRIGRTARMEKDGIAISLVSSEELKDLNRIRGMTRIRINEINLNMTFDEPKNEIKQKCAKCGKEFQPKFTISDNRPVYCIDCYTNHQKNKQKRSIKNLRN